MVRYSDEYIHECISKDYIKLYTYLIVKNTIILLENTNSNHIYITYSIYIHTFKI